MTIRPITLIAILAIPALALGARELRFPRTVQRVMDRLDTNEDQVLDTTEYERITRGSIAFKKADLDSDGTITVEELEALLLEKTPLTGGLNPIIHGPVQAYLPGDSAQTFRPPASTPWPKPAPEDGKTKTAEAPDA